RQVRGSKKTTEAAKRRKDIPDGQLTKELRAQLRRLDMAKVREENQTEAAGRERQKNKPGSHDNDNGKVAVKREKLLEGGDQSLATPLSCLSPKSIMDLEMELVYTDEEDIPFEFADPVEPTSTQSSRHGSEEDAVGTSDDVPLPQIDKQLQVTLKAASSCYRENNYEAAVEQLSTAWELCSKGAATEDPIETYPEDISSIASFIETKFVICYLKLKKPEEALNHSHRSIILNPAYFRNHLRQAAVFRCLERCSEAARSAMVADHIYWLMGGTEQHTSKLIKRYWQVIHEEAMIREVSFTAMYTPFVAGGKADKIEKLKSIFAKKHPGYVEHIYTDPHGFHILPQTAGNPPLPPRQYLLTLGFRSKHIGKILERWSDKKLPIFSDRKAPFCPVTEEETKAFWKNTGKRILPIMDFIRSTKLTDSRCPCSRGIEKLHLASCLGRLQREGEQSQVIHQALAELATVPYLQDLKKRDARLLQSLMADAMDTLEGSCDGERVWSRIQKIGLIEDYLFQAEDDYLQKKRLRRDKTVETKMNRTHPA
ncbi:Spermatogenesis-associated protein 16, partial [Chaetura pelagica]